MFQAKANKEVLKMRPCEKEAVLNATNGATTVCI